MAFGAWGALQERGLSWPTDVAIVGVDDHELAPMVGLTSVRLNPRNLGGVATDLLLQLMRDDGIFDRDDEVSRVADEATNEGVEIVARRSTLGASA